MTHLIETKFKDQTQSIALYAKRIGFCAETGNFNDLFRGWIEDGRKTMQFLDDNKAEVVSVLKRFVKK